MKITSTIKTEKPINVGLSDAPNGNASYAVVRPDFYQAVITGVEDKVYAGNNGQKYLSIIPTVNLLNDDSTVIGRQSYTVGALNDKNELVPLKEGKPAIWGGENGALFFFVALGLVEGSGNDLTITVDTEQISDRIVIVRTGIGAYVKGGRNWSALDVSEIMEAEYGKEWVTRIYESFDHTAEEIIIDAISRATGEAGEIKLKNVIRGWYSVSRSEVENNGWFSPDGKQVFVNEVAYRSFLDLQDKHGNTDGW